MKVLLVRLKRHSLTWAYRPHGYNFGMLIPGPFIDSFVLDSSRACGLPQV